MSAPVPLATDRFVDIFTINDVPPVILSFSPNSPVSVFLRATFIRLFLGSNPRINAVAPGLIHSSGLDSYAPEFKQYIMAAGKNNQANRMGTEEEVAAAVLFLLSPAASYITGETLKVDAGESLYSPLFPPSDHDNFPPYKD